MFDLLGDLMSGVTGGLFGDWLRKRRAERLRRNASGDGPIHHPHQPYSVRAPYGESVMTGGSGHLAPVRLQA